MTRLSISVVQTRMLARVLGLTCSLIGLQSAAQAQLFEPQHFETTVPWYMVDEIRLGAIKQAIDDAPHEGGAALDVEVLFGRLPGNYENSILNYFLTPRLHVGSLVSFGKTDEYYWGATWDLKLFDRVFFESSFGGAAHDGPLDHLGWASYGCRVNFRESASLGYALTREWRVMAEVDHMSNAGLCDSNRGLTNAGLRLGYKF